MSQNREGHNVLFQIQLRGVKRLGFDEEAAEEEAALKSPESGADEESDEQDGELPDDYQPSSFACKFVLMDEVDFVCFFFFWMLG